MKLIEVLFEEAITGEKYVTIMKYGIISGRWDADTKTCSGYYWRDMEWYPQKLYTIEEETSEVSQVRYFKI